MVYRLSRSQPPFFESAWKRTTGSIGPSSLKKSVGREGIEPPQPTAADLQSAELTTLLNLPAVDHDFRASRPFAGSCSRPPRTVPPFGGATTHVALGGLLAARAEHEEVVQAQLETLVAFEREASVGKSARRLPRRVAVVLVERHACDEPDARERVDDVVDRRFGHGHHDTTAGSDETRACSDSTPLRLVVQVLEDREDRDDVEPLVSREVFGEATVDEADLRICPLLRRVRIDPHPADVTAAQDAEERAIRRTDIEHARTSRDVRCRLADPPTLKEPIEKLHRSS